MRITLRNVPINKPDLAAKNKRGKFVKFAEETQEVNKIPYQAKLTPNKKRGGGSIRKSVRVKETVQTHMNIDELMLSTTKI